MVPLNPSRQGGPPGRQALLLLCCLRVRLRPQHLEVRVVLLDLRVLWHQPRQENRLVLLAPEVPLGLPALWHRQRQEVRLGLRVLRRHRQEVRSVQEVRLDQRAPWHRPRQEHQLARLDLRVL